MGTGLALNLRYGARALPSQPHSPIKLGASRHANTDTHHLILHDSIPIGTDFIGSAAALPVSPAEPSQTVLGSDFAGGTVPRRPRSTMVSPPSSRRAQRRRDSPG